MAGVGAAPDANEPAWRERAVSRSLNAARSRAEQRVQRFLDAAFELIDEKGTTEFTIQEVVERSKQSLRGFYEYFAGKDELVLALFEEIDPRSRRRHPRRPSTPKPTRSRGCAPTRSGSTSGATRSRRPASAARHNRRAISEFSMHLAANNSERIRAALAPLSHLLLELLDAAAAAGAIHVADTRRAAALVQQTVMNNWFGNRLVNDPKQRLTAEETWEFCLHGLGS